MISKKEAIKLFEQALEDTEQQKQAEQTPEDVKGGVKYLGFSRILSSHFAYWILENWRRIIYAVIVIIVMLVLIRLFTGYVFLYFVVSVVALSVLAWLVKSKNKVYLIDFSIKSDTPDTFRVYSMPPSHFDEFSIDGNMSTIPTKFGRAYLCEGIDFEKKTIKSAWIHKDYSYMLEKGAFVLVKNNYITELKENHLLYQLVEVKSEESVKYPLARLARVYHAKVDMNETELKTLEGEIRSELTKLQTDAKDDTKGGD